MNAKSADNEAYDWGHTCGIVAALAAGVACLLGQSKSE